MVVKLSVIIPAFNEEKTIAEIISRVDRVNLDGIRKEMIIVNDGSTDKTYKILSLLKTQISNLVIIQHKKNQGKGKAIQSGIRRADGDIVLIQDADLEYNPNDIPKLVKPIVEGKAQVVYGTRLRVKPVLWGRNKTPFLLHFLGNKALSFLTSILYGSQITDMETGYKVFRRKILDDIKLKARSFDFEPEITAKILKKRVKIQEVDIQTKPRSYKEGKKINTVKDGVIALWSLCKYKFMD